MLRKYCTLTLAVLAGWLAGGRTSPAEALPAPATTRVTAAQVIAEAKKTADAQLAKLPPRPLDWIAATMYAGFGDFTATSGQGAYLDAINTIGTRAQWIPLTRRGNPFHADDFCIGQAFLDIYATTHDKTVITPLQIRLDELVGHLNAENDPKKLTWWWCDALFMAPAVLTRMSALSGQPIYINAMDREWWRVADALYDKDEHFFYRDSRFIGMKTKNGKKVFWARGNGWVVGGTARVLEFMPADFAARPKYTALLRDMSARLRTLQHADGTWGSSLLDAEEYPGAETSGTAFYCYGMAWGINHKLLDREQYLPVVAKAWAALLAARRSDGLVGYVQAPGDRPGPANPGDTQVYSTGALLLAAGQLAKLAPFDMPPAPKLLTGSAPAPASTEPAPNAKAYARYVPERMDDIAWENDRIAHRIYGPALQNNPKEHSGSGIDVWVKSVRRLVINDWYRGGHYHEDHGTGLDFYEVGASRGDGGLGIWDGGKLYNSKDWTEQKVLDKGPDECGFSIAYAPWDANGRKVWEHRTMTLKAGANLTRIESTIDSDKPDDLIVGIGLASRKGEGGRVSQDKDRGILSYWQPPEKYGTIGVGVVVDPAMIVGFEKDPLNYLVLIKVQPGKPFVYYAGACWSKGLDFKTADDWEKYLKEFKRE